MKNNNGMKKVLILIILAVSYTPIPAQLLSKMEIKNPIEGICNDKEVYALFPSIDTDQIEAASPISKPEILDKLNSKILFLKENKKFKGEGIVKVIINCSGEVVLCKVSKKTKSIKLDEQIEEVFNNLGEWKNATYKKRNVDSVQLFYFKVKRGKISWKY